MASELVSSLVRQASQQGEAPTIPHWVLPKAVLSYVSRSTGATMEVVVDHVSYSKQMVFISFAHDARAKQGVPFAQLMSDKCPLQRRAAGSGLSAAKTAAAVKVAAASDDPDQYFGALEKHWTTQKAKSARKEFSFDGPCPEQKIPQRARKPTGATLDIDSSPERNIGSSPEPVRAGPELVVDVSKTEPVVETLDSPEPERPTAAAPGSGGDERERRRKKSQSARRGRGRDRERDAKERSPPRDKKRRSPSRKARQRSSSRRRRSRSRSRDRRRR